MAYDVTRRDSFDHVHDWLQEIQRYARSANLPVMLVATKSDLAAEREVSWEEGQELAQRLGLAFLECSAKTGQNVGACFERTAALAMAVAEAQNTAGG